MSVRSGRKRGAAESVAVSHSDASTGAIPAPETKRFRLPKGALKEDNTPIGADHPSVALRKFWDQFHTDLLRGWLMDFPDWKKFLPSAKTASRELLLITIIEREVPRIAGKMPAVRQQLARAFGRAFPGIAAPGAFEQLEQRPVASPSPPAAVASRARMPQQAPAPPPAAAISMDDEEEMGDDEEDDLAPAAVASAASARPHVVIAMGDDPQWTLGCLTCTTIPPEASVRRNGAWLCAHCHLRGDLATGAPENAYIRKERAPVHGQSAPSAADGQFTRPVTDSAPTDKLEKHLCALSQQLGSSHPLFDKAVAAPSPADAIRTARQALGCSTTETPSAKLIELIQAGKLLDVWFAVPRPFLREIGTVDTLASISFGAGGPIVSTVKDPTKSQPLASIEEFFSALISTILPALIDRPAATAQWLSLSASVLHIAGKDGWTAARGYLDALLRERVGVAEKLPFATPSDSALRDIRMLAPFAPSGQMGQRVPSRGSCHQFQNQGICTRVGCSFDHSCAGCGDPSHGATQRSSCSIGYKAPIPGAGRLATPGSKRQQQRGGSARSAPASGSGTSVVTSTPASKSHA